MDQIVLKNFDDLKEFLIGKTISNVIEGCSIFDDAVGIEEIWFSDGSRLDMWGSADCVMTNYGWIEKE